jgi:hypothetical protein
MMYHTVRIRDLAPQPPVAGTDQKVPRRTRKGSSISEEFWESSIDNSSDRDRFPYYSDRNNYRPTYFQANGPHTHIIGEGHALFEAYLAAYSAHEDLVLSPDDIWLMITIYYSNYVVLNAEQMRHLFVDHEEKKELVVDMMTMEPE